MRVAVLIPCRDEEKTLERKLANLRGLRFPGGEPPLVLVVDDHSEADGLEAIASRSAALEGIEVRFLRSPFPPGKAGALEAGLRAARECDVVVVTDADVTLERNALGRLLEPFADPEVLVVSGEQRVVPRHEGAEALDGEAEVFYDRFTRAVRRREARSGFVFSVHGECLAVRSAAGLRAERGLASDDLDLALEARRRGGKVLYAEGARFFEVRPPTGEGRRRQEIRRARSFVQFVARRWRALFDRRLSRRDRVRLLLYFSIPLLPFVALGVASGAVAFAAVDPSPSSVALVAVLASPLLLRGGRDVARRLVRLGRAVVEYPFGVRATDRWEPVR